MTINTEYLIRAGSLAQKEFNLKEGYGVQIFPSDCPETVLVYKFLDPEPVSYLPPSPFARAPERDEVELCLFGNLKNDQLIRMGYSERLNILCLSLV